MENKKNEELLEKKCNCECDDACDCHKGLCECDDECNCVNNEEVESDTIDELEELIDEDFCGTYSVNFDYDYDELDELESMHYELDAKKLALIGLGAVLAGGAVCYAVKKRKNKKNNKNKRK